MPPAVSRAHAGEMLAETVERPPGVHDTERVCTMAATIGNVGIEATKAVSPAQDRDISLFGFDVCDTTIGQAARWIVARASQGRPTNVAFVNAHCINVSYRSTEYRAAVTSMDRIFADGIGMRIAAKASAIELQDNVNGTDLFPVLCGEAARAGVGLYLFGAQDGVAAEAGERMRAAIPGLAISGTHHGYLENSAAETRAIESINQSGAGILLVAMGVPSQELWIARNRHRITAPVVIGVGGLFDYYSGRIARAPLALRRAGLEWAWRLALEPKRLAKRYLAGNVEFLSRLAYLKVAQPDSFRPSQTT